MAAAAAAGALLASSAASSSSGSAATGGAALNLSAASLRRAAPPPPSTPLRSPSLCKPEAPLFSPSDGLGLFQSASESCASSAAGGLLFSPLHTPQRPLASSSHSHSHSHFFSETPSQSPGVSLHHLFSPVAFHSQQPHGQQQQTPAAPSLGALAFASPSPFACLTPATPERRQRHHAAAAAASPIALLLSSPSPPSQQDSSSSPDRARGAAAPALPSSQPQQRSVVVSPTRFFCLSSPVRQPESGSARQAAGSPRSASDAACDEQPSLPVLLVTVTSAPASPSAPLLSPHSSAAAVTSVTIAATEAAAAGQRRFPVLQPSSRRPAEADAEQSLRTPCKAAAVSVTPASASSSASSVSSFTFRASTSASEEATDGDRLRPPHHNGIETPLQPPRASSIQTLLPATPGTAQQLQQSLDAGLLKRAAAATPSNNWDDAAASAAPRAVAMLVS